MIPSSISVSDANTILNTIVAESLCQIADKLEASEDFHNDVQHIIREIVIKHKRIIFNGDGYSKDWEAEAEKRGLPNIKNTVDAASAIISTKAVKLFEKHRVLSNVELHSRYEVILENYIKQINIEALTMIEMSKKEILPAVIKYIDSLAVSINAVKATGIPVDISTQAELLVEVSTTLSSFKKTLKHLEEVIIQAQNFSGNSMEQASFYRDEVLKAMNALRFFGDSLETLLDSSLWPIPTYGDMLFSI